MTPTPTKALIPAAGLGTRYLPWSKAVPKELIPVGAYPVLHYVVAEAKAAGCREIGIILSEGKEAIRTYFTHDAELEARLERDGKSAFLEDWRELMDGLSFTWLEQREQKGLGDAVYCGAEFAEGEPVYVLLGDTLMEGGSPLNGMRDTYLATGTSQVGVEAVEPERATRYGVCGGKGISEGVFQLDRMIENPAAEEIPSMQAVDGRPLTHAHAFAARYLLTPAVFEALATAEPGKHNEIQLTDAMARAMESEGFHAVRLPGRRKDIGAPADNHPLPQYG